MRSERRTIWRRHGYSSQFQAFLCQPLVISRLDSGGSTIIAIDYHSVCPTGPVKPNAVKVLVAWFAVLLRSYARRQSVDERRTSPAAYVSGDGRR